MLLHRSVVIQIAVSLVTQQGVVGEPWVVQQRPFYTSTHPLYKSTQFVTHME